MLLYEYICFACMSNLFVIDHDFPYHIFIVNIVFDIEF